MPSADAEVGDLIEASFYNDVRLVKDLLAAALGARPVRVRPKKRKVDRG
jgi:hypothetical protein